MEKDKKSKGSKVKKKAVDYSIESVLEIKGDINKFEEQSNRCAPKKKEETNQCETAERKKTKSAVMAKKPKAVVETKKHESNDSNITKYGEGVKIWIFSVFRNVAYLMMKMGTTENRTICKVRNSTQEK